MNRTSILLLSILFLFKQESDSQNISGIINSYAVVTGISGATVSVANSAAFTPGDKILLIQMKGAEIDTNNNAGFGDITALNGAGTFEFLNIVNVAPNVLVSSVAPIHAYNTNSGYVQVVRIPRYCSAAVTGTLTCVAWSNFAKTGGVLALEAGTLTLNGDIVVSEKGFKGGIFTTGVFGCDHGNYKGLPGFFGGQKGESISAFIVGMEGLKGKQANGGGASNPGNSGGGGGGNGGMGGFGGDQYNGCGGLLDERGVGGLSLISGASSAFMGGGGGGGIKDNTFVASNGGNGGGIIYIHANTIIANNRTIASNGASVTVIADAEGSGGGGAGGSVFIECNSITGSLNVTTDGGAGGSNNNNAFPGDCHGTGGGGGGGVFAFSASSLPPGVSYSSFGGAAGTVNNPISSCFGTTNGATDGTAGISFPNLPTTAVVISTPTLLITGSSAICKGETTTITVSGAPNYHWNTGATTSVIVVSPTVTSSYTVTGLGPNSCEASQVVSLVVSPCDGVNAFGAGEEGIKMYPNPTSGEVFFELRVPVKIIICDGIGRTLQEYTLQKGEHSLDLTKYPSGVYLIKAESSSGRRVIKLIKAE